MYIFIQQISHIYKYLTNRASPYEQMRCKSVGFGTKTRWFRDGIQNYVSYPGVNELDMYSCSSLKQISCGYTPHSQGVNLHQASTCMVAGVMLHFEEMNRRKTELRIFFAGVKLFLAKWTGVKQNLIKFIQA